MVAGEQTMKRERRVDLENLQCGVVCRYRFATMRRHSIAPHRASMHSAMAMLRRLTNWAYR